MNRSEALEQLRQRNWTIEEGAAVPLELPSAIAIRYPKLPNALTEFLSGLSACASPDETTWFLCQQDYHGISDSAFSWDEFERMSIDSAENDEQVLADVRDFWNQHFPFMLSVRDGYSYYAICTSPERFGQVVEGYEPLFEDADVIAESFTRFIEDFIKDSSE